MTPAARRALRAARPLAPVYEARRRITNQYEPDALVVLQPGDALTRVALAARHAAMSPEADLGDLHQPPDERTVLDGLMQVDQARVGVEIDELRLITYARHLGVTWERIGEALAYGTASQTGMERDARIKGAQARFTALAKRHPHLAVKFDEELEARRRAGEE